MVSDRQRSARRRRRFDIPAPMAARGMFQQVVTQPRQGEVDLAIPSWFDHFRCDKPHAVLAGVCSVDSETTRDVGHATRPPVMGHGHQECPVDIGEVGQGAGVHELADLTAGLIYTVLGLPSVDDGGATVCSPGVAGPTS